jgi:hypothetical protein
MTRRSHAFIPSEPMNHRYSRPRRSLANSPVGAPHIACRRKPPEYRLPDGLLTRNPMAFRAVHVFGCPSAREPSRRIPSLYNLDMRMIRPRDRVGQAPLRQNGKNCLLPGLEFQSPSACRSANPRRISVPAVTARHPADILPARQECLARKPTALRIQPNSDRAGVVVLLLRAS